MGDAGYVGCLSFAERLRGGRDASVLRYGTPLVLHFGRSYYIQAKMTDRTACGESFSEVVYSSSALEALILLGSALIIAMIIFSKQTV